MSPEHVLMYAAEKSMYPEHILGCAGRKSMYPEHVFGCAAGKSMYPEHVLGLFNELWESVQPTVSVLIFHRRSQIVLTDVHG